MTYILKKRYWGLIVFFLGDYRIFYYDTSKYTRKHQNIFGSIYLIGVTISCLISINVHNDNTIWVHILLDIN